MKLGAGLFLWLGDEHRQQCCNRDDEGDDVNRHDGADAALYAQIAQQQTGGKGRNRWSRLDSRNGHHAAGAGVLLFGEHHRDGSGIGRELEGFKCAGEGTHGKDVPELEIASRKQGKHADCCQTGSEIADRHNQFAIECDQQVRLPPD